MYSEAIGCYNRFIKTDPNYADAWYNQGNALCELGRYHEAIVFFDMAIKRDSNRANTWYNKGVALVNLGKEKNADKCFVKARELCFKF
jgi:tetratricopeptide (TPR) repeat protein